jgi:hypothetical protein
MAVSASNASAKFNYNPRSSKSLKRSAICQDCRETPSLNGGASQLISTDMFITGHAKSNLRVQLAGLKDKQAALEKELRDKEDELQRLKSKTSEAAKAKAKEEL